MYEAIVITPVKDSIDTTLRTIEAVSNSEGDFRYIVYNDFSTPETRKVLENQALISRFELVNLEDYISNPSPNYKKILEFAQQRALQEKIPLIIVESDVIVRKNTLGGLIKISSEKKEAGLIGAITVNESGEYNFPYSYEKFKSNEIVNTKRSLSFCCTLISLSFLEKFDFTGLSAKKDWFDISVSRKSRNIGFNNYLAKNLEVLHMPHSSRPWKNLKYSNPVLYYLQKYLKKRDRI